MKFMLEDSIMAAGQTCTAGSAMLYNFISPISAAAYEKCIAVGMEFTGFVKPDEFGLDSLFADDSAPEDVPEAVSAILDNKCGAVLCGDVFGKISRAAAAGGLVYIRPAYGTVSRYGLIPAASSMDQIGVLCRNISAGVKILSEISGHDPRDGASLPDAACDYSCGTVPNKIGLPDIFSPELSPTLSKYTKTVEIKLNNFDIFAPVFYTLAAAEISNNISRYDGIKFGLRAAGAESVNDIYVKSRSDGFGFDAKMAALAGCMVLSKEHYETLYHKSMQLRGMIKQELDALLGVYGAIALPSRLNDGNKFGQLALYAPAMLCGYASVSFRAADGVGVQLIAPRGREADIFKLAEEAAK